MLGCAIGFSCLGTESSDGTFPAESLTLTLTLTSAASQEEGAERFLWLHASNCHAGEARGRTSFHRSYTSS